MSNAKSIAVVTATLRRTLQAAINTEIGAAKVTTVRPDTLTQPAPPPAVNLYLYQVTPNAARRNETVPTRSGNGTLVQRPRAALDLHYLFSFYGNDAELEPQRLLAAVARTLHSRPLVTRKSIQDMLGDPAFSFLAGANLDQDEEVVRVTPTTLSLEELSKLWSVFFQTPYTLSTAYTASVLMVETDEVSTQPLPVRERSITVLPFRAPTVTSIASDLGPGLPIAAGATLVIRGYNLRGDLAQVKIDGVDAGAFTLVDDEQVTLVLPATIASGVHSLQVVHRLNLGNPPVPHTGAESNVEAFVVSPKLSSIAHTATTFTIGVSPVARARQRAVLLLNNVTTARAFAFALAPLAADTASLVFPVSGLNPGKYFVRVQVGGGESSLLDLSPGAPTPRPFIAPQVTV